MTNQNPSENEKEKIYNRIGRLQEDIWEIRDYISSDYCKQCSEMYIKLHKLEEELIDLNRKLMNDECS